MLFRSAEIFDTVRRLNAEDGISILLVEQNANIAFSIADYAYIMESGQIVMEGPAAKLRDDAEVRNYYLGVSSDTKRKSFRDIKHYKRRKRWLS